jgi:hypothetical protein
VKRLIVAVLLVLAAATLVCADEPYVELYATSGLILAEETDDKSQAHYWSQDEYVGAKVVGRLPWRDFAAVVRGEVKGLPGQFAYDAPGSFTALIGDVGGTWTPLDWRGAAIGLIATYGEAWSLSDDRGPVRESIWGAGVTVRHEATRSWIAAGFAQSTFYGAGLSPRVVIHAPILGPTALEADIVWGDAPAINLSANVGWSK